MSRKLLGLSVLMTLVVAFAIACGGEPQVVTVVVEKQVAGEKVVQTVVVEKQVAGEKVVQTVVVEKQVAGEKVIQTVVVEKPVERIVEKLVIATPTPVPTIAVPPAPKGKMVVAHSDVGVPLYNCFNMSFPANAQNSAYGILEELGNRKADGYYQGELADAWTMDSDGFGITYSIRRGVPFHGRGQEWGEVTATDVLWTYQDCGEEGTRRTGSYGRVYDFSKSRVLDRYTVYLKRKEEFIINPDTGTGILSKRVFDERGRDWQTKNEVGTGPFTVVDHRADDHLYLEAVPRHWRKPAGVARVEFLEVPEEAARIAMLKTGEADIVQIALTSAGTAKQTTGVKLVRPQLPAVNGYTIFPAGQYYDPGPQGEKVERTLHTELPWVGDPKDPAKWESARKVRLALSMAIDRRAIVDKIMAGEGCSLPVMVMYDCHPRWQAKWDVKFDPDGAKKLLAEAGYPNGFQLNFFLPSGLSPTVDEVGLAVATMWEKIGLKPAIESTAYSAKRPSMLARTITDMWLFRWKTVVDQPFELNEMRAAGPVWNPGIEHAYNRDMGVKLFSKATSEHMWNVFNEWMDWQRENMLAIGTATDAPIWPVGPRIKEWVMPTGSALYPEFLENVVLK